ncbi:hypothetical protein ANN_01866 [Periplaneta americana]|uniref:Uncharacterized protein n=1 Tax=Periplaneta americana TaxID=6978 RepID=A0ABQ8TWH5_PERAM|nr:hypothetical protein ANN_01866 [Periplaneta americana]
MASLCEGGNEPSGSLKAICNKPHSYLSELSELSYLSAHRFFLQLSPLFGQNSEPALQSIAEARTPNPTTPSIRKLEHNSPLMARKLLPSHTPKERNHMVPSLVIWEAKGEEVKLRWCEVWTVGWVTATSMPLTLGGVAAVTGRPERASFFEEPAPPGDVAMVQTISTIDLQHFPVDFTQTFLFCSEKTDYISLLFTSI